MNPSSIFFKYCWFFKHCSSCHLLISIISDNQLYHYGLAVNGSYSVSEGVHWQIHLGSMSYRMRMHQLFAVSLGSIACKTNCKELLGRTKSRHFLTWRESPGQDRKSHSVVESRKELDWPEHNALGLLSSFTVFLQIFTTHLLIVVSLELWSQEQILGKTLQASFCQHWKHHWQHNLGYSTHPSVAFTSLFIRKHKPRKGMGVSYIFLSHFPHLQYQTL